MDGSVGGAENGGAVDLVAHSDNTENEIQTEAAATIATALTQNKTLTYLDLRGNVDRIEYVVSHHHRHMTVT